MDLQTQSLPHHHASHAGERNCPAPDAALIESLERRGIRCADAECAKDVIELARAIAMYDEACSAASRVLVLARRPADAPPQRHDDETITAYVERVTRMAHRLAHAGEIS